MSIYPPQGGGVAKHTALTDKEVAGAIDHAPLSVRGANMYDRDAWLKLLASQPAQTLKGLSKLWRAFYAQKYCTCLAFDGTYLYVALDTSPAQVLKMDILHMFDLPMNGDTRWPKAIWTGANGQNSCKALAFDGTYLYAALGTSPAQVVQIDIATMATMATWTGDTGENDCAGLTCDGAYVYAGLNITPAMVIKLDTTMGVVDKWTGGAGENACIALAFDGDYVYAGLNTSPAQVIQLSKATYRHMEKVEAFVGDTGQDYVSALALDGNYIYLCTDQANVWVIQINPGTMETVKDYQAAHAYTGIVCDGKYLYASYPSVPLVIEVFDVSDMSLIATWQSTIGEMMCASFASLDQNHFYAAFSTDPPMVVEFQTYDLTNHKTWIGEAGQGTALSVAYTPTIPQVFIGLAGDPCTVLDFDPNLNYLQAFWQGDPGQNGVVALCVNGNYLFVASGTTPGYVYQLDWRNMTLVASWPYPDIDHVGYSGTALASDGTYLYVALNGGQSAAAVVCKVRISDMTEVARWVGDTGQNGTMDVIFDGSDIYAALSPYSGGPPAADPAQVVKIAVDTMQTILSWGGAAGQTNAFCLAEDSGFVYVGLETSPGQIVKIEKAGMVTGANWGGAGDQNIVHALKKLGNFLFAGLAEYGKPAQIVKIAVAGMTTALGWSSQPDKICLASDGLFIYAGFYSLTAQVARKIIKQRDQEGG